MHGGHSTTPIAPDALPSSKLHGQDSVRLISQLYSTMSRRWAQIARLMAVLACAAVLVDAQVGGLPITTSCRGLWWPLHVREGGGPGCPTHGPPTHGHSALSQWNVWPHGMHLCIRKPIRSHPVHPPASLWALDALPPASAAMEATAVSPRPA